MTIKDKAIVISVSMASLLTLAPSVGAQECTTQYGGTVTCPPTDVTINKMVAQPVTKGGVFTYVENLGTSQPFAAENEIAYRLVVKNTSNVTIQTATVKDVLPTYLTFVSGPGTYDANTRTLTIVLEDLKAGESRTIDFVAKVVAAKDFPAGQSSFCVTNYAEVRADGRFDDDTAQACVVVAPNLPVAGFNDMFLLLPFAGVGLSGLALLKKRS